MKPRLIRAAYFIWLVVPLTAYVAVATYGLPHLVWTTRGRDYAAGRFHTRCTYIGPYGTFTVYFPRHGDCPVFRLFRPEGKRS